MGRGFLQDGRGDWSMMRFGVLMVVVVGAIVSLAGVVAMFYNLDHAGTAITTGMGALVGGPIAKAWQAKYEQHTVPGNS